MPWYGCGAVVCWSLLFAAIIAVVRQKLHLATCSGAMVVPMGAGEGHRSVGSRGGARGTEWDARLENNPAAAPPERAPATAEPAQPPHGLDAHMPRWLLQAAWGEAEA